jgi:glycosyltransferase involved in cell wall biosynthesis
MMERPLRFCMITTFYPPYNFGGDGIFVHRLSNELARDGHQVDVIHCRDAYRFMAGKEPACGYDDHPNVTVHGLKSPFGFLSPLATQQTGRPLFKSKAIRRILEKGFDVIHFHNISLFGPKILEYGKAVKLYTMHEYWLVCPTHVLFRFNRAPCIRPYCFVCTLIHKRPPQWWRYSGLLQAAAKHVDLFIAPSRFIKEKHLEMGFKAPIVHLPYFVPDMNDGFESAQNGTPENKPYFLFVGRLEKLKGAQTLIPVFRNYPKARLLVAGTGNYETELRRLAEGSENIQFLGHCSEQQLTPLYRQAVAVIVPSLWYENSPMVLIEAFRHGTPAIARGFGALPEMIEENGGGLVYRTEEELVAAMDELLEDAAKRVTLAERSRQTYRRCCTTQAHLTRYFALIEEIASKHLSPPTPNSAAFNDTGMSGNKLE